MEPEIVISIIISLTILYLFIRMTFHVGHIRDNTEKNFYDERIALYKAAEHTGDKGNNSNAHRYLLEAYYYQLMAIQPHLRQHKHRELEYQMTPYFQAIDTVFPELDSDLLEK